MTQGLTPRVLSPFRSLARRTCALLLVATGFSAAVHAQTASTTVLVSSPNPSTAGQSVTLTATVSGSTPLGAITFKDGASVLGTVPLTNGVASLPANALGAGTHDIQAFYGAAATWNPLDKGPSLTLSAGNLSASANISSVRGLSGATSGKWYFEVTITSTNLYQLIGVGTMDAAINTYPGANAESWSMYAYDGTKYTGGAKTPYASQIANGSVVGVLLDLDNHTLGFRINGVDKGLAFTNLPTSKPLYPMFGGGASGYTSSVTANFGATSFKYQPPQGYSAAVNMSGTSTSISHVVNQAAASSVLSASPSVATEGQNVSLTTRVTGFTPTGTVTITEGATVLGSAPIVAGAATIGINSLAIGDHSLVARYEGDTNNLSAVSSPLAVSITARSGFVWQYGYDAMGRPNTVVDPNGQATYFYYDSLGRRIQTQQPPNTGSTTPTVTQFGYDGMDSLTSVTDPRNLSTTYTRDGLGQAKAQSSPDSGAGSFTYDANGNVLTSTDARGKTTTLTYDVLDRVASVTYASGTPTTFEYDGGTSPYPGATGELTKMTDESGNTTYSYDSMGRMTGKTVVIGSRTFTVGYTWGESGTAVDKLTAVTYPSGNRVNYSYDQYGSVSGITINPVNANGEGQSGTAVPLLTGVTYNVDNLVSGWLWSDGKARTIGFDANGMVSSYTLGDPLGTGATAGLLRSVQRDPAGRITGYTHTSNGSPAAGFDQTFGYDNLDRLTTATQASSTTQYSYDESGNRTAKTVGGTAYTNTVSATSNRLNQVQDPTGTATFGHDAAGNVVGDGSFTYSYSDRGRLAGVTIGSGAVNYLYNGLGQRVRKAATPGTGLVPGGPIHFVYDEAGQLLGEYDAGGNPRYETIYLGRTPVGVLKQAGSAGGGDIAVSVYNVYADHIDTPRVITKQDHTVVWRWDAAEPFGATAPDQNPTGQGTFAYNQRFPGQVFDQETGLFQNWNRDYDAKIGRYRQSDPIGLAGGINTFSYAEGRPTDLVDPTGLTAYDIRLAMQCIKEKMPWLRIPEWDMGSSHNPRTKYSWGGRYSRITDTITFNAAMWGGELGPIEIGGLTVTATHEVMHGNQSLPDFAWTNIKERFGNESHNMEAHDAVFNRDIVQCVLKKKQQKVCN